MSWPVGVITRDINFSSPIDAESGSDILTKRAIVSIGDLVIHIPTGVPLLPTPEVFTDSFSLPVTDQADDIWGDGYGYLFSASDGHHTHYYNIDIEYQVNGAWVKGRSIREVVIPTADLTPVDLDLVFEVNRTVYDHASA